MRRPGRVCGPARQAALRLQARQGAHQEEREQVERSVNEKVFQNLPVRTFVTPIEEARKLGAMMLFGEKYGDEVRVVEIDGYSRELCGGTHVRSTAEIGPFVILSEGSVGSGVRRIEAITAGEAWAALRARSELDETRAELERTRKGSPRARRRGRLGDRHQGRVQRNRGRRGRGREGLRAQGRIRPAAQSKKADAVLLGSVDDGRAYLVVNLDQSLVEKGLDAVQVARKAAERSAVAAVAARRSPRQEGRTLTGSPRRMRSRGRDRGHCVKVPASTTGRPGPASQSPTPQGHSRGRSDPWRRPPPRTG